MLLTEAILSGTKARTNYVLKEEIDYNYGYYAPSLVFKNSITDASILFYMEEIMRPEIDFSETVHLSCKPEIAQQKTTFFNLIRNLTPHPHDEKQKDMDARGIIVLGQLCELICKAGLPVTILVNHIDLFERYIKESLEFYGYSERRYNFSLTEVLDVLQIKTDEEVKLGYPAAALLCQMADGETRYIGYVSYKDYKVSLGVEGSAEYVLEIPDVFPIEQIYDESRQRGYMLQKAHISSYLTYILLAFTGFYFDKYNLRNFAISSKEDLEGCKPEDFDVQDYITVDLFNLAESLEEVKNL